MSSLFPRGQSVPPRGESSLSSYGYTPAGETPERPFSVASAVNPAAAADLPFLPGYTFSDPRRQRFGRKDTLAPSAAKLSRSTTPMSQPPPSTTPPRSQVMSSLTYGRDSRASVAGSVAPDLQGKSLQFSAYVKEPVHESTNGESYRVRYFIVSFFLEDETVQITERRIRNSGLPQGKSTARQRLLKEGSDEYYTYLDFCIGEDILVHGRVFHIYNCTQVARDALEDAGISVPPAEEPPEDEYIRRREAEEERMRKPLMPGYRADEFKRFTEGLLKFPSHLLEGDTLKQFLEKDRKVLKFFCSWDNRLQLFGQIEYFILFYFLADDTIQIVQMQQERGRGSFGIFVKRSRIPRKFSGLESLSTHQDKRRFISTDDLAIGVSLDIFGRTFVVHDCDPYTRQWLCERDGVAEITPLEPERNPTAAGPKRIVPPHIGVGDEADSIGNVLRIVPKPPRKDIEKYIRLDGKILRWSMVLDTEDPDEAERSFTLQYYLADDTIGVLENRKRNSGRQGGTFLRRMRVRKEDGSFFTPEDIAVGETVTFHSHRFRVLEMDQYTASYLSGEEKPRVSMSVDQLHEQLRAKFYQMRQTVRGAFLQADTDHDGEITLHEFERMLHRFDLHPSDQEVLGLMRKFDLDGDGRIKFREFVEAIQDSSRMARAPEEIVEDANKDLSDDEFARRIVEADAESEQQQSVHRVLETLRDQLFCRRHLFTEGIYGVFDRNRDGFISKAEFQWGLENLRIVLTEHDHNALFGHMYTGPNGEPVEKVDYRTFLGKLNYYEGSLDQPGAVSYVHHPGLEPTEVGTVTKPAPSTGLEGETLFPGATPARRTQSRLSTYSQQ